MREQKPEYSSSPAPGAGHSPRECFFCGRHQSGKWRYATSLGHVVCDECGRGAMTAPAEKPLKRSGNARE